MGGDDTTSAKIAFWPVLPVEKIVCKGGVSDMISKFTETLTGEVLMVGSLLNFKLGADLEKNIAVVEGILHAGLGYVASMEGSMVALHGPHRAALSLQNNTVAHSKLFSRSKDVIRMLKKVQKSEQKDGKLSLRINTDFDTAIKKLRQHHKQSWVLPDLEKTWKIMFDRQQLIIVELWCGEELIAADIGHPVEGGSFYVATRFFDEGYKRYQPGFLLALVENRILKDVFGVQMWDLGSTDSNPAMAYKATVADIMARSEHLQTFRHLQAKNKGVVPTISKGVIIPNITVNHLLRVTKD